MRKKTDKQTSYCLGKSIYPWSFALGFLPFLSYASDANTVDGAATEPEVVLPELIIQQSPRNDVESYSSFVMPVTLLRYDPQVDVQARGIAEAQSDISIRGGIFENTGFRIGAIQLFDPQTGHYFAEIPISPHMLSLPVVYTGTENAWRGFNATAGTIASQWANVAQSGANATVLFGSDDFNMEEIYGAWVKPFKSTDWGYDRIAVDADFARSEGDGSIAYADHDFARYNGRVQLSGEGVQTDIFAGYQSKFFSYPQLYAPSNTIETENLQTTLVFLNHRMEETEDAYLEMSGYYRRNKDDYEFDRFRPGIYNPYKHESQVWAAGLEGGRRFDAFDVNVSAQVLNDGLETTSLFYGPTLNRTYGKVAALAGRTFTFGNDWEVRPEAGIALDDSSYDDAAVSPIAKLLFVQNVGDEGQNQLYVSYDRSTQVPGYTALGGSMSSGLFRGNPDLDRQITDNFEISASLLRKNWNLQTTVFLREDNDLTDWTFNTGGGARNASLVDMRTLGWETIGTYRQEFFAATIGYIWMDKHEDYNDPAVNASFYAGNYAKQRVTASFVFYPVEGMEIHCDNEYRLQEENSLRNGTRDAFFTGLSVSYALPFLPELTLVAGVDNVWNEDFEEVPSVPGSKRTWFFGGSMQF